MIPEGPLHPADAALALASGAFAAALVRPASRRWTIAVIAAVVAVVGQRHGPLLLAGIVDRPAPLVPVVVGTLAVTVTSVHVARRRPPAMRVVLAVLAALAVLWARVPDTEVALIAGATLLGAVPPLRARVRLRNTGLLAVLPLLAALTGTLGRPDRLGSASLSATAAAVGVYALMTLISRSTRRAGTPTTVAPRLTSSRTTAPAPTIAP